MSKRKANFLIFSIGACGYGLLEIIWRGYTHWSMLWAGGLSFLGLSSVSKVTKNMGLLIKGILGGGLITVIEFFFGLVFNIILKKNVWDYSRLPLNINGQICALYSLIWMLLSMIFVPFVGRLSEKLQKKKSR